MYTKDDQLFQNKKPKKSTFGKRKPKPKRNDIVDDEYSSWLAEQGCVITGIKAQRGAGAYDIHCHHIDGRNGGRNDYFQVPLVGFLHSWGENAYHNLSKKDFVIKNNLLIDDIDDFFRKKAYEFIEKYKESGSVLIENTL